MTPATGRIRSSSVNRVRMHVAFLGFVGVGCPFVGCPCNDYRRLSVAWCYDGLLEVLFGGVGVRRGLEAQMVGGEWRSHTQGTGAVT